MRTIFIVAYVAAASIVAFAVLYLLPQSPVRAYVVTSGSMEPAIMRGALVISVAQSPSEYHLGDVVIFSAPVYKQREKVVHRISEYSVESGYALLSTKGDANTSGDPWTLRPENLEGRVVFTIPYIGTLLGLFHLRIVLICGIVCLTIVSIIIARDIAQDRTSIS
jgi:signal peptidase